MNTKQIKNYGYSLIFAGAQLFASGVANAENSHQLNDEAENFTGRNSHYFGRWMYYEG